MEIGGKAVELYVDGPYGSASEDVFGFEVMILVGAGIGGLWPARVRAMAEAQRREFTSFIEDVALSGKTTGACQGAVTWARVSVVHAPTPLSRKPMREVATADMPWHARRRRE